MNMKKKEIDKEFNEISKKLQQSFINHLIFIFIIVYFLMLLWLIFNYFK